jgi:hypothetical protein
LLNIRRLPRETAFRQFRESREHQCLRCLRVICNRLTPALEKSKSGAARIKQHLSRAKKIRRAQTFALTFVFQLN